MNQDLDLNNLLQVIDKEVERWNSFSSEILKYRPESPIKKTPLIKADKQPSKNCQQKQDPNKKLIQNQVRELPAKDKNAKQKELALWMQLQREKKIKEQLTLKLKEANKRTDQLEREKAYWKEQSIAINRQFTKPNPIRQNAKKSPVALEAKLREQRYALKDKDSTIKRQQYLMEQLAAQCAYLSEIEADLCASHGLIRPNRKEAPRPTALKAQDPLNFLQQFLDTVKNDPDWHAEKKMNPDSKKKLDYQRLVRYNLEPLVDLRALYPIHDSIAQNEVADTKSSFNLKDSFK